MGVPAPAIPVCNSYCVHFSGFDVSFHAAAEALLNPLKVVTRRFNEPTGEEFWKTTVAVVSAEGGSPWSPRHSGGECPRECLLVAVSNGEDAGQNTVSIRTPDLWLVQGGGPDSAETVAKKWIGWGAGGVVAFHAGGSAFWISRNGALGRSNGARDYGSPTGKASPDFGIFTGGLILALIEELLVENEFSKTSVSLERECLEMLPLHLAPAVETGLAAHETFTEGDAMILLHEKGGALDAVRRRLRKWRGPAAESWGARGR